MNTLQLVSRDGSTQLVKVDPYQPLLPQLALPEHLLAFHDGARLVSGDTFVSREMKNKDFLDLIEPY